MADESATRSPNAGLIRAIAIILVTLPIVAGYFAYQRYTATYTVEKESDGRAIGRVVDARLDRMGDLRVSRLRGTVQGVSTDARLGGLLNSTRVMKAPFEVGYFVDLSTLDRGSFFWNEKTRKLIVLVPEVRVDRVNVDESRTTLDRTQGVFVTRDAMAKLRMAASASAHGVASKEAKKPENIGRARENGRRAIKALFERPLRVAGIDAEVEVRFEGETRDDDQELDRSRSLAEIFAGAG